MLLKYIIVLCLFPHYFYIKKESFTHTSALILPWNTFIRQNETFCKSRYFCQIVSLNSQSPCYQRYQKIPIVLILHIHIINAKSDRNGQHAVPDRGRNTAIHCFNKPLTDIKPDSCTARCSRSACAVEFIEHFLRVYLMSRYGI